MDGSTPTRETFGNIPASSQAVFYALTVLAMAVFAYGVWRRFSLWRLGRPIHTRTLLLGNLRQILDKWTPGLRRVLIEGYGQQRIRGRGLPSWAHGWLVAGSLMLFLGTTLLEIDHLASMVSERLKFHHGVYYVIYEFTLDVFGLLFLVGVVLFFWRRLRKPPSVGHRATDWYVLASFLSIGLTGYAVEGLRMVWQQPTGIGAHCSPVGGWIASGLSGLSMPGARGAHLVVWWVHSLLVFAFIATVPFTRLFHMIAGPLNLFFARPALGELEPITLEEVEKEERLGVRDIRHFNQQELLSLDACMECGRCEEACPAFATGKPLSPKRVVQDLKGVMDRLVASSARAVPARGEAGSVDPTAPAAELSTNVHETIQPETLWSCTACSACTYVCPVRVDPLSLILDMRRHLVAESALRGTAATALRRMQSSANPWGLPAIARADWIQTLNTPPAGSSP